MADILRINMIINRIKPEIKTGIPSVNTLADMAQYATDGSVVLYTGENDGAFLKNSFYRYSFMFEVPMYRIIGMLDNTNIWYVTLFGANAPLFEWNGTETKTSEFIISEVETVVYDAQKQYLCTVRSSISGIDVGIWLSDWFPITDYFPEPIYTYKEPRPSGNWIKVDIK